MSVQETVTPSPVETPVIPAADLIGAEGEGFRCILHGMNPERILIAAEAVGIGRVALQRAAGYARERVVFGRPIGQNQGIAHPLARCWMNLEAANLADYRVAALGRAVEGRYGALREGHLPLFGVVLREALTPPSHPA